MHLWVYTVNVDLESHIYKFYVDQKLDYFCAPVHGLCAFPVYTAQAPGCSPGELSKAGPGLCASPGESGLVSRGSQGLRSPLESQRVSLEPTEWPKGSQASCGV